jgi:hypothetical protein
LRGSKPHSLRASGAEARPDHPIRGYEESFYIGLRCFLKGETDGVFFLPLPDGGYVRLVFSQRRSAGGHPILRVDPLSSEGLQRIKVAVNGGN